MILSLTNLTMFIGKPIGFGEFGWILYEFGVLCFWRGAPKGPKTWRRRLILPPCVPASKQWAPGVGRCQRWQPRSNQFGHCALSYCTVLRSNSNSPIISINFLVTSIYFNSLLHLFPLIQLHWVSTVCDAVCNRSSKPVAKRLGKKREWESQIRCQIPAGLWLCARCRRIWRSAWDVDPKISEECASLQGLSSKLNKIIRYYKIL